MSGAVRDVAGRGGLDWAGLMRAGLHDLRLCPDRFWALTPAELGLMMGLGGAQAAPMTRDRLAGLVATYPDAPPAAGAGTAGSMGGQDDGME